MFRLFLLFLLFYNTIFSSFAQISGQINNEKKENIEFANVSLHSLPDSTVITGQLSDAEGKFSFDFPQKITDYYVKVSQIGFKTNYSTIFSNKNSSTIQLTIILEEDVKNLEGVEIFAKKNFLEYQADKTILNVENSVFSNGLSSSDILKRAPGVAVDQNGGLSLKGRKEVLVLIDGKPTYLTDEQVGRLLKSLPANQIATIEISTTPSAKFDAEGNAGYINIKLKKNAINGFHGDINISAGQGWFSKQNTGIHLNYKKGITNITANYDFNYDVWMNNYKSDRNIQSTQGTTTFNQNAYYRVPNVTHTLKLAADFNISPTLTMGVQGQGLQTSNSWQGGNQTQLFDNSVLNQNLITQDFSKDFFREFTSNFYIRYQKDSLSELSFDADYAKFDQRNPQGFITRTYNQAGAEIAPVFILNSKVPTLMDIYAFKADYTRKIGKSKLETGAKWSWVNTDNDMRFVQTINNIESIDTRRTNHFIYRENIWAAYVNFSGKKDKLTYQFGLRAEKTTTRGEQRITNQIFTRDYFNLFPQISLDYQWNKKNAIGINYNKRIDRPNYKSLNPFVYFLDLYASEAGNPFLTPQFTNHTELNYRFDEWLQITANYSQTDFVMTDILKQNSTTQEMIYTKDNLESFINYGISANIALPITDKWQVNHFLHFFHNSFSGIYLNIPLKNQSLAYSFTWQHQISLPKKWTLEIAGNYNSGQSQGIMQQKSMWLLSMGVQRSIWKDKGTIKAFINDIFWAEVYRNETKFADIDATGLYRHDTRVFTIAFSYRFGKNLFQNDNTKTRKTALEEEKERMKGK
ncbi:MAG: TonB-dependent receptor [Cytophagia bacterium]|nr:MAG: TonB-dependent receptor [Cytophagia bacterium]TAG43052.1 MAG: TonB-dependent receptor [Cytophagia bacterium]